MSDDLGKAERAMIARARHAFTRLAGLEAGDELADQLYEARSKRAAERSSPRSAA